MPRLGRDDFVDNRSSGNGREGGESRRRRLGTLLHTHEQGADFLGGRVVVDGDDRAGRDIRSVVVDEINRGLDEGGDRGLVVILQGDADVGNGVRLERELGDKSKVVGASLECPEELGVVGFVGDNLCAIAEDDVVAQNIVHGESILVDEVVEAANQGQSGYTNGLESAADGVETIFVEGIVHIDPAVSRADLNRRFVGVDSGRVQEAERDQDTAIDVVGAGVLKK